MPDRVLNEKPGINYCMPVGQLGFRGICGKSGLARLIPLPAKGNRDEEIFFFHGVDVPAVNLPYLPDMGPESDFIAKGHWHHYEIRNGIFIIHLKPNGNYEGRHVLHAVLFAGEEKPRVFLDRCEDLAREGILGPVEMRQIEDILTKAQIVL